MPEVQEITWLLSCVTGMGLPLERALPPRQGRQGHQAVGRLFTYPVLMAADILAYDLDAVPVGKDQVQHVEMAQDMAQHFKTRATARSSAGRRRGSPRTRTRRRCLPDGEKMSKSYGNGVWIRVRQAAQEAASDRS
ncbi:MAG: hypothetical protein R3F34_16345 [Planctomycetota bacterium]